MNPLTKMGFSELMEEAGRRIHARAIEVRRLVDVAGPHGSIRFERADAKALAGPCPSNPGKFRLTRFDEQGPYGHTVFNAMEGAVESALMEGFAAS